MRFSDVLRHPMFGAWLGFRDADSLGFVDLDRAIHILWNWNLCWSSFYHQMVLTSGNVIGRRRTRVVCCSMEGGEFPS